MKINNPNLPTQGLINNLFKKQFKYFPSNGMVFHHDLFKNIWFKISGRDSKINDK